MYDTKNHKRDVTFSFPPLLSQIVNFSDPLQLERDVLYGRPLRSRTEWRLKDEEKNFEFNAGGERKTMNLLCQKRKMREKRGRRAMSSGVPSRSAAEQKCRAGRQPPIWEKTFFSARKM